MAPAAGKPSALIDTRVIYCGDSLDQLRKLPNECVDLIHIDPPFNSNRNYEVFWGETKEKRSFEDRHESMKAYIEYMRPPAPSCIAFGKWPDGERLYVEENLSVRDIIAHGFDEKTVRWVQRRVDLNEYKREQAAPGLKVTSRAFGVGRRMPIAQKYVD